MYQCVLVIDQEILSLKQKEDRLGTETGAAFEEGRGDRIVVTFFYVFFYVSLS